MCSVGDLDLPTSNPKKKENPAMKKIPITQKAVSDGFI